MVSNPLKPAQIYPFVTLTPASGKDQGEKKRKINPGAMTICSMTGKTGKAPYGATIHGPGPASLPDSLLHVFGGGDKLWWLSYLSFVFKLFPLFSLS